MSVSNDNSGLQRLSEGATPQPSQKIAAGGEPNPVTGRAGEALRKSGEDIAAGSGKDLKVTATTGDNTKDQNTTAAVAGPILDAARQPAANSDSYRGSPAAVAPFKPTGYEKLAKERNSSLQPHGSLADRSDSNAENMVYSHLAKLHEDEKRKADLENPKAAVLDSLLKGNVPKANDKAIKSENSMLKPADKRADAFENDGQGDKSANAKSAQDRGKPLTVLDMSLEDWEQKMTTRWGGLPDDFVKERDWIEANPSQPSATTAAAEAPKKPAEAPKKENATAAVKPTATPTPAAKSTPSKATVKAAEGEKIAASKPATVAKPVVSAAALAAKKFPVPKDIQAGIDNLRNMGIPLSDEEERIIRENADLPIVKEILNSRSTYPYEDMNKKLIVHANKKFDATSHADAFKQITNWLKDQNDLGNVMKSLGESINQYHPLISSEELEKSLANTRLEQAKQFVASAPTATAVLRNAELATLTLKKGQIPNSNFTFPLYVSPTLKKELIDHFEHLVARAEQIYSQVNVYAAKEFLAAFKDIKKSSYQAFINDVKNDPRFKFWEAKANLLR